MKKAIILLLPLFLLLIVFEGCEQRDFERQKAVVTDDNDKDEIGVTTASIKGTVIDLGENGIVYEYGHCWSLEPNPTVDDNRTIEKDLNTTATFESSLSELIPEKKYYYRSYVKNGANYIYGEEKEFETGKYSYANLVNVSEIDKSPTFIKISTEIESIGNGSAMVTEYGHCWSETNPTPQINNNDGITINSNTNKGIEYTSLVYGLTPEKKYFFRAYATNEAGTIYSNPIEITTLHPGETSGVNFIDVEGDTFSMGLAELGDTEIHSVSLNDFKIGSVEVTNKMYADFLNRYGSKIVQQGEYKGQDMLRFKTESDGKNWGVSYDGQKWSVATSGYDKYPVVRMTWYGANEFCNFFGGRLPTEAEWEYAAKGGNLSGNYKFAGSDNAESVAWYGMSIQLGGKTHETAKKQANELGIYDMTGNVSEWCSDWYNADYYKQSPVSNPTGPASGSVEDPEKVYRGGGWNNSEEYLKVGRRQKIIPTSVKYDIGFRMVIN